MDLAEVNPVKIVTLNNQKLQNPEADFYSEKIMQWGVAIHI